MVTHALQNSYSCIKKVVGGASVSIVKTNDIDIGLCWHLQLNLRITCFPHQNLVKLIKALQSPTIVTNLNMISLQGKTNTKNMHQRILKIQSRFWPHHLHPNITHPYVCYKKVCFQSETSFISSIPPPFACLQDLMENDTYYINKHGWELMY